MNEIVSVTLLVDNEAPPGLLAEHGFAAWIDTGDACLLFDTGQGAALEPNARTLGIELGRASDLVLSHGHYDHSGAVEAFLAGNSHAPIMHGHGATVRRFSCHAQQPARQIGMGETVQQALARLPPERYCVLDAPRSDSTNTDEPRASGLTQASAWIDKKRSDCTRRAFWTRICNGTKKSESRVSTARMLGSASIRAFRRLATASVTFFS